MHLPTRSRASAAALAAALLVALSPAPAQGAARPYAAIDLGTLGGATSAAFAMNDAGQVVGISQTAAGQAHAFLWSAGRMTDLGTLPGGTYSVAVDINAGGLVVGNASDAAGVQHAVAWDRGRIIDLGHLGGGDGSVVAVNDRGQEEHAFRWHDGVMQDLGTLGGPGSRATAINDRGAVVGFAAVADQVNRPFLWRAGVMTDLTGRGLTADDDLSDINDRGELAGTRSGRAMLFR